jgi:hypothetical protein
MGAKLNELLEGSPYAVRPLGEAVERAADDPAARPLFNNAARLARMVGYTVGA